MLTAIVGAIVSALLGAVCGGMVSHCHWRSELKVMNRRLRDDRRRALRDRRNERRNQAILDALDALAEVYGLFAQHGLTWDGDDGKRIPGFQTAKVRLHVAMTVLGKRTTPAERAEVVRLYHTLDEAPVADCHAKTVKSLTDLRAALADLLAALD